MTWMLAWQHFLEVKLGTCVMSRVEPKTRPNSFTNAARLLLLLFVCPSLMEINHILLEAQKLGLANMSGTWDPCDPALFTKMNTL